MTRRSTTAREPESFLTRDDKDFAIEFGGYLADSAEAFLEFLNQSGAGAHIKDQDGLLDHWRGLRSAIYEFRKRAGRT